MAARCWLCASRSLIFDFAERWTCRLILSLMCSSALVSPDIHAHSELNSTPVVALSNNHTAADDNVPVFRVALMESYYKSMGQKGRQGLQKKRRAVAVDLIREITNKTGWRAEFVTMPYLRALHELKIGHVDMMYGAHVESLTTRIPQGVVSANSHMNETPLGLYSLAGRGIEASSWEQARQYRIGSMRLVEHKKRAPALAQDNAAYFKNMESAAKALLAGYVDLLTLDIASYRGIETQFNTQLTEVFHYGALQSYPIFSRASERLRDPMIFCERFFLAQQEAILSGAYANIFRTHGLAFMIPYLNRDMDAGCHVSQNPDDD